MKRLALTMGIATLSIFPGYLLIPIIGWQWLLGITLVLFGLSWAWTLELIGKPRRRP